jgi:hypothetical protein
MAVAPSPASRRLRGLADQTHARTAVRHGAVVAPRGEPPVGEHGEGKHPARVPLRSPPCLPCAPPWESSARSYERVRCPVEDKAAHPTAHQTLAGRRDLASPLRLPPRVCGAAEGNAGAAVPCCTCGAFPAAVTRLSSTGRTASQLPRRGRGDGPEEEVRRLRPLGPALFLAAAREKAGGRAPSCSGRAV